METKPTARDETKVRSYRDLKVWQKAMDIVVDSYRLARLLPREETYGLAAQIRRSATSIPANIAEGHGRHHLGDYLHHLSVAKGSLTELETHFLIAQRLRYLTEKQVHEILAQTDELGRMLTGLRHSLEETRSH